MQGLEQMTTEEYTAKENIFLREVCKTHCKLCEVKRPEFCMFFLGYLGKKYFTDILLLIKVARERKPRLIEALQSFEGFSAIFCNASVCQFNSPQCQTRQKLSCYQMFLLQSGQTLEEGEDDKLFVDWDRGYHREICNELDGVAKIINSMGKKKRKRLFKIATRVLNMMNRWHGHNPAACGYSSKKVKKKVTTELFHNDSEEWAARIKSILEGDDQVEDSNRKQHIIN